MRDLLGVALAIATVLLACGPAQVASSPSPSAIFAPSAAAPQASRSPSQTGSPRPLPPSTAVKMDKTLPASGQWAIFVTRSYDQSPTDPSQASGPRRLPTHESIAAVPISARATTPRDTLSLASFTSAVQGKPGADNLLREQFSPDGRRLVLSVVVGEGANARLGLVILDLVAGTAGSLTDDATYHDAQPAWGPSGEEIAFVRLSVAGAVGTGNDGGIWLVRSDGTGLRRVLDPATAPNSTGLYSWNADGTALGFSRGFEGSGYGLLDLLTGRTTSISGHSAKERGMADWRDGRPAFAGAFMEGQYGGKQYLVTADDQHGGGARDVVVGPANDGNSFFFQARWRPGSNDLLYLRTSADTTVQPVKMTSTLFVTDAGGRTPRAIKTVVYERMIAAWTPDGRDVVFLTGLGVAGAVRLIAPDGTNERVVQAFGGAPESYLEWIDLAVLSL